MSTKRSRLLALAASAAMLVMVAGPVAAADDAMVRVLHASPDAPAVDVYVDGAKVGDPLAGLEFGDLSTYVALPAGTYDLKVCAAADATVCPIVANGVALAAGTSYTIAATNDLSSIEAQIITDAPAPVAGMTQVRVVHFSADTPAIDVLTQDGSAKVVENLAYPDATDYLTLDPGSYDLKVCANADNSVCPLDPGALDLMDGKSYSVFAIGSLQGDTLTAAVGLDAVIAAPAPPPTDTVGQAAPSSSVWSALLIGAGIVTMLGAVRLVGRRIER